MVFHMVLVMLVPEYAARLSNDQTCREFWKSILGKGYKPVIATGSHVAVVYGERVLVAVDPKTAIDDPSRWDLVLVGDKGTRAFRRSATDWIVTPGSINLGDSDSQCPCCVAVGRRCHRMVQSL